MREPTELDSRVAGACGVSADSFDALGLRCTSLPFRDTRQPPRPEQNARTDRDCRVRAGPAITAPRRALAPTFLGVRGLVGLYALSRCPDGGRDGGVPIMRRASSADYWRSC